MNTTDIDDDLEDFNAEVLERAVEDLKDQTAAGRDHVLAAMGAIRRCIDVIADARIDNGALSGRALDDHLEQLLGIEGDLSRADGELADAGPLKPAASSTSKKLVRGATRRIPIQMSYAVLMRLTMSR